MRREYEGPIYEALWDLCDDKHIRDDDYGRDLINDAGDLLVALHDLAAKYDKGEIQDHDVGVELMKLWRMEI